MYIYGKNVALETIKNNEKIKRAFLYRNFSDQDIVRGLESLDVNIKYLEKYELDKMVEGMNQGIILEVDDFIYNDVDEIIDEDGLIVILDHLEDPHNFGAIIRTCEAANVSGIIIPKDRSVQVNNTVIKVSTGAIKNMKIAQVTNLNRTIEYLKDKGFWLVGTDMEGTPYDSIDYNGKIAIVVGNEGTGLARLVKENCDFVATIPMKGKTNSLNVSVATGIILFEALRQRK